MHSFAPIAVSDDDVLGTSAYGEPFVCAVEREPLYGVQFHPEKSSAHGLRLLRNFASICAAVGAHSVSPAPELYPAIDILDGKAVRLEQGDFERRKEYDADPLDAARRWVAQGARRLHVVDLDGAREGRPVNLRPARADRRRRTACRSSTGAGCAPSRPSARRWAPGADRVVIGTTAFADPDALDAMVQSSAETGSRSRWTCGRAWSRPRAGWRAPSSTAPQAAIALRRPRGEQASSTRTSTATAPSRDRTWRRSERVLDAAGEARSSTRAGSGPLDDLRAAGARLPISRA